MKLKLKTSVVKNKNDLHTQLEKRREVIEEAVNNMKPAIPVQIEVKKKDKVPPKKVVYTSKRGSKAIFDSVRLCATIFGKDESTIRYKIEHPNSKDRHNSWLKGGKLEYYNN